MAEQTNAVDVFRPVLNIEQSQLDDMHQLAAERNLNKLHFESSLVYRVLRADEVRYFYERAQVEPTTEDISGLADFLHDCQSDLATDEVEVPTWPETVIEKKVRESATQTRLHERLFVGAEVCFMGQERQDMKDLVALYGDNYGPLEGAWPQDVPCGMEVAHAQRREFGEKSQIRSFIRGLKKVEILPRMIELGPVQIVPDITNEVES